MLVKYSFYIIVSYLLLLIASCEKQLTNEEYAVYVTDPENGLRINETVNDFDLSVMYEPSEYFAAKSEAQFTVEEVATFEHFQFRIKLIEGGNILLYKENQNINEVTRINHFGFTVKEDFFIVAGQDTLNCKLAHYSRNYNLSPTIDLSLTFDAIPKTNDWQFVYDDQQFNLGRVKFLFKSEDLSDLPALKR